MIYNSLLGYPLERVIDFFNKKGITIEQIECTRPTKVNDMYKNERVVRIKETKDSVLIVVAMFPDFDTGAKVS